MLICARSNCRKPVYIESDGYTHPYCGKTCASVAISVAINTIGKCSYSFCRRPRYMDADGKIFDYCGRTCANRLEKGDENQCQQFIDLIEPTKYYSFCNRECYWTEINELTTTKITLISKMDLDYIQISDNFLKVLPNIKIQGILRLQMPKKIGEAHLNLRKKEKIVYQMYHGTSANCDLKRLIKYQRPQCNLPISTTVATGGCNLFGGGVERVGKACGVCGIIREGNSTKHSKHNGQMWFARQPSISMGYTSGEYRAIFCVDVVTGDNSDYATINSNAVSIQ
ncbi:1062_t:CDS:2 [Diversispora eburnea]|uniref:1062_t:CDS:1 n=1 Tax=Diversispora eburnea TaxID=1213867 RepID=A0A9N8Z9E9_9GLOM|nr:1062_t:CDS:2 [Diversispora eburnea]